MTPGGTQLTDWVLTIKNGATAAASVQVSNAYTNESVVWANALAVNAWLRLSSETQRCEVSTDSGANWTRRNENVTGVIPQLQGGVSNVITITGLVGATADYTYTAKGV